MEDMGTEVQFQELWTYFEKVWLDVWYRISDWNVHHIAYSQQNKEYLGTF
jgi:hypothetical protein